MNAVTRPWGYDSDSWSITEDCGFSPPISSVSELKLVEIAKLDGKGRLDPAEILRLARLVSPWLGKDHAAWLTDESRKKGHTIPDAFFRTIIVFPGTIWRFNSERVEEHRFFFLNAESSRDRGQPNGFFNYGPWHGGYFYSADTTVSVLQPR